jgi:hypothetical protein
VAPRATRDRCGEPIHVPLSEPGLAASEIDLFVHRVRAGAHHISVVADELRREFNLLEDDIRPIPSQ